MARWVSEDYLRKFLAGVGKHCLKHHFDPYIFVLVDSCYIFEMQMFVTRADTQQ